MSHLRDAFVRFQKTINHITMDTLWLAFMAGYLYAKEGDK